MPTFDAKTAQCEVLTEKEGLLSAVAHDLCLAVTGFTVTVDEQSIEARFDPGSLRARHALKDGRPTDALSDKDKRDIQAHLVEDVLHVARYPEIRFVSTAIHRQADGATIAGNLTLHGATRPLSVTVRRDGESWVAEAPIHQPDFGIKPFSAMMGTLKVKPRVRVRVTVPRW